ncbi:hypothetical protein [Ralstonia syzygii]|uniref:hypothetical protein n=1 Tax=Ralstonia syzygii TaxID=28097 RepID=UPI0018D0D980|nr:hypothetical protein [Ralstonia syzygii]
MTYLHVLLMAVAAACLHMLWRSWVGLDRLGLAQELARKAPGLRTKQNIAAAFLSAPFVMAAADWFDLMMVGQDAPISSGFTVLCSVACLGAALFMLRDSAEILAGDWAVTRESALRAVAAKPHESGQFTGRTIEAEAREVRK